MYEEKVTSFIERSYILFSRYKGVDEYDVTLSINFLFALIVVPKSKYYSKLEKQQLAFAHLPSVKVFLDDNPVEVCNALVFFHCCRNGIAHWSEKGNDNIDFEYSNGEIIRVIIEGTGKVKSKVRTLRVEINEDEDGIKEFVDYIYTFLRQVFLSGNSK